MIGQAISPAQMAQDAARSMTEGQRLALATQWINSAIEHDSLLQLIRISNAADAVVTGLQRERFLAESG